MSRRPDYNHFPNPKVTVIVNERPGSSTTKRVFNNSSISASNSNGTGVEIEMPRKWPTRKGHATMINRDKRIEFGGTFDRKLSREQRIVEKVQTKNRLFQPLGLIRQASGGSTETQSTRTGRKPIEAPSLSDIKINQRPAKPRFTAASGKADRLIELAPIEQASSSTAPLVLPRPSKVAPEVKPQTQQEPAITVPEGRIKRSLLNPILPPGKEKPKELKAVEQREDKKLDSPPVKKLQQPNSPKVSTDSQPKSKPEEESVPIVISKEVEEPVKEQLTSPVKEEATPSKDIVETSVVADVPTDSTVQTEEMLRVFPPKQTYDPEKMTAADREIMQKDILRTRKRRITPVSSRSSSPKASPRKRHEPSEHRRHDSKPNKIAPHSEIKKFEKEKQKEREKRVNSTGRITSTSKSSSPKASPRKRHEPWEDKRPERKSSKTSSLSVAKEGVKEAKKLDRKENSLEKTAAVNPLSPSNTPEGHQSHSGRGRVIPFADDPSYIFCNKYPIPDFQLRGKTFTCPLHYCLWRKAKFCNNPEVASKILESTDSKEMEECAKGLKCDEEEWLELSWKYVVEANYEKYQQSEVARLQLFQTLDAKIAEANANEKYWSCGLDIKDRNINDPHKWTGDNVMGKVLMEVRDLLAEKVEYAEEMHKIKKNLSVNKKQGHSKENGK